MPNPTWSLFQMFKTLKWKFYFIKKGSGFSIAGDIHRVTRGTAPFWNYGNAVAQSIFRTSEIFYKSYKNNQLYCGLRHINSHCYIVRWVTLGKLISWQLTSSVEGSVFGVGTSWSCPQVLLLTLLWGSASFSSLTGYGRGKH